MTALLLRASVVLPVSQPPIANGAVALKHNRIIAVGPWRDLSRAVRGPMLDLGDQILLPGLINAHCHLDYTDMAGLVPPPKSFPDWIKSLLALKAQWSYSDYAQSWLNGARMLVRSGTTTVADIEAVPELLPEVWTSTPLRMFSLLEMTGVKSRRPPGDILREAATKIDSLPPGPNQAGLSPHAPYSTSPALLELCGQAARKRGWPVAIHLAESCAEFDMFMHRRGPLFTWLKRQRDMSDCDGSSPVRHAARHRLLGKNVLAIHVNYLAEGDASLLARHRSSVVHCPRSHRYFGHDPFPRKELASAGCNLCLGTDSLVSVKPAPRKEQVLDLFDDMRTLASSPGGPSPETVLRMATVNGAAALNMSGKLGELREGAFADLIVIPLPSGTEDPEEAVVHHLGGPAGCMIDGRWVVTPEAAASGS